jgi:isoleucyl-tRNA synthetase
MARKKAKTKAKTKRGSGKKAYFDEVDTKANFPKMEMELLKKWYKKGTVDKYLKLNDKSKKRFSFLDGPITANNPMGVHHAWGRTYKDLWQRYFNMKGFKQRFQNGFDCQGLWVEVEVEKQLGLKNKQDIENLVSGDERASIDKFVDLCKKRVYKYADIQTEQSKRLGYFMDWENSYYTLSDDNNYMIWYFLKKCHEKGLIYKGNDVVPWCPRCETAISEHEILTEDYKEVVHQSLYLKFPIVGRKDEYLLVWTTTPWTVPANIAIAVDKTMQYVLVNVEGEKYWILKDLKDRVLGRGAKIVKEVVGDKLVGITYTGAFDNLETVSVAKREKGFHQVIATNNLIMPISNSEGTGLVHTSTGTGAEDHRLGKELNLPVVAAIEDDASYLPGFGWLTGRNAKKHPELIIDYLKDYQKGKYLFKVENYKHRYPACWRCKTELVWKLTDEWYIAIDPVREDMKKVTRKIDWLPKFGLKREIDWLKNMHDWLISKKNRYWGLALPIWECEECGNFEVIGSFDELKQKAVEGWKDFKGHSPHKPWVDEVKIKCSKCGSIISRIKDVGNPWLDAGIVTFSTISEDNSAANPKRKGKPLYLKDKKEWRKWAPVDFITESFPGQFKNWFYSLIAMSSVLEKKEPTKTVLGHGTLLAEDGRPMHKSWGNAIEFNEGAEKIGVDVMRWMYVRQNPEDNLLFGFRNADEVRRQFHLKLWNVYNYFVTYANLDGWKPNNKLASGLKIDKKVNVLDRWILSRLSQSVSQVDEFLKNYDAYSASIAIEEFVDDLSNWYIRRSRQRTGVSANNRNDKNDFYKTTYFVLLNLAKLLAPFTPFLAEMIFVNLTKEESVHLSKWPEIKIDPDLKLIENMTKVRMIAEKAHAQRKEEQIPVRQPLSSFSVNTTFLGKYLEGLLKDELNVKAVKWGESDKGELKVKLDTKITPQLEQEAKTRELIRNVQRERKRMGMGLTHNIIITNQWFPKSKKMIQNLKDITLAKRLREGKFSVKKTS